MTDTKNLLIVAHAPSENTARLRDAALAGASSSEISGVTVRCLTPFEAGPEDVLAANAVLLGTTENLGYMSGALKDFFDRTYYPCLEHTQGLPYGLYIRAGHDGDRHSTWRREHCHRPALAGRARAVAVSWGLGRRLRRPVRGTRHAAGGRTGSRHFLEDNLPRRSGGVNAVAQVLVGVPVLGVSPVAREQLDIRASSGAATGHVQAKAGA
jgi:hypothetical protein